MRAHTAALIQRTLEDYPHTGRMPSVPQFLGHNIPIYEEGALISAVTAVMYARLLPEISAKNVPRNLWWAYFYRMEKKGFQLHRRHYSYWTWKASYPLDLLYNHPLHYIKITLQPPPSSYKNILFFFRSYDQMTVLICMVAFLVPHTPTRSTTTPRYKRFQ